MLFHTYLQATDKTCQSAMHLECLHVNICYQINYPHSSCHKLQHYIKRALKWKTNHIQSTQIQWGYEMAQAVKSPDPHSGGQGSCPGHCGLCGAQSGTEIGFSQSSSASPGQYHSNVALHTHVMWG
jgi:hypothetical protein